MFIELLERISANCQSSEQLAVINDDGHFTFRQLGAKCREIRALIEGESCVAIVGHKEFDAIAAMVACAFEGIPFTFIDRCVPIKRLSSILQACGATYVYVASTIELRLGQTSTICTKPAEKLSFSDVSPKSEELCQQTFYIAYTSGSTGDPKAIGVSRQNFDSFRLWFEKCLPNDSDAPIHVSHALLSFDYGMLDVWPNLALGKAVALVDHKYNAFPVQLVKKLDIYSEMIGSWSSTPSMFHIMMHSPQFCQEQFPRLSFLLSAGETPSKRLMRDLMARFPMSRIFNGYGPTETTCMTHCCEVKASELDLYESISVGDCRGHNQVWIQAQSNGKICKSGFGKVIISGPQVANGFPRLKTGLIKLDNDTEGYITGDLGYLDPDGLLFISGRSDDQIKVCGFRVSLNEIEKVAEELCGLVAVAVPRLIDNSVVGIVLFVIERPNIVSPDYSQLRLHLLSRLPYYMCPRDIRFTHSALMTPNMKLDRRAYERLVHLGETHV